jgi:hypothetical protein
VRHKLAPLLVLAALVSAAACGDDEADQPEPATTAEAAATTAGVDSGAAAGAASLDGVKTYLTDHTAALVGEGGALVEGSQQYYDLAEAAGFDYAALWRDNGDEVSTLLTGLQEHFRQANPAYEQMEGVVAGVPSLSRFDVILDAGASAADDPENAVPFDLELPDGRVLEQPGNLFYLLETTLFGTNPDFVAADVEADLDGDGSIELGEALPEANMLLGSAKTFDSYARELQTSAAAWSPSEGDAFTALVVMIPTMNEYFESWKNSRFVAGDAATEDGFVAVSRLSDIADILSGLQVVYDGVRPMVAGADAARADQIGASLDELTSSIAALRDEESGGRVFEAEEADQLGADKQARASDIAGQISQVAAQLGVEIAA